jgi:hypothetical protein
MNQTPALSSAASLRGEKFIDDLSMLFDDLRETNNFWESVHATVFDADKTGAAALAAWTQEGVGSSQI